MGQVLKVLEGHTGYVESVAISTDDSKIVSGSWDKTVRVWSAETGEVPVATRLLLLLLLCMLHGMMGAIRSTANTQTIRKRWNSNRSITISISKSAGLTDC